LPENVARTVNVSQESFKTLRLCKMQDQIPLTLSWHSFVGWGTERIAFYFTYQDGQYFHYARV
jgi:hypothetical protein